MFLCPCPHDAQRGVQPVNGVTNVEDGYHLSDAYYHFSYLAEYLQMDDAVALAPKS